MARVAVSRFDLRLPPGAHAPRVAREAVAKACREWRLQRMSDDAQLIISELVTNGVLHAGGELWVTVILDPEHLRLYVRDSGGGIPRFPAELGRERRNIGGLGLMLVDRLAVNWGTTVGAGSKTVWATLAVPT